MSVVRALAPLSAVLLQAACGLSPSGGPDRPAQATWQTLVHTDPNNNCYEPYDRLIRTEEQWAAYWSAAYEGANPQPERPVVNFASESLLVACESYDPYGRAHRITVVSYDGASDSVVDATVTAYNYDFERCGDPGYGGPAVIYYGQHVVKVQGTFSSAVFSHETVEACY